MPTKIPPLWWILASVLCSSMAHLALKLGAGRLDLQGTLLELVPRIAGNVWLTGGMLLHVFALGLWVLGLQQVQLSLAYPFIAVGFVLVALLSWLFLGETIGAWRIAGMALIIGGVCIVARS